LRSKILHELKETVVLRHEAGAQATLDDILKADRKCLTEQYELTARYQFKAAKIALSVRAGLKDMKITVTLDLPPPENKGARASVNWFAKAAAKTGTANTSVLFDWPGPRNKVWMMLEEFIRDPDPAFKGQQKPPKRILLMREVHDVRRFKSRKHFVTDTESAVMSVVRDARTAGWL